MTEALLTLGCALLAFGPTVALFTLIVSQKAQLVIVVTTAAFFFLLAAVCAAASWWMFATIGLNGPLAAILPGVFFQFLARGIFVSVYHSVEQVIQVTLHRQVEEETRRCNNQNNNNSDASVRAARASSNWVEQASLRLQLNDASCGIAAGIGFGGMHAIMMYGTLLASQSSSVGILYQESCPAIPSLVVSALLACMFSILDLFWMLFTFFGVRRRALYHRGSGGGGPAAGMEATRRGGGGRRHSLGGWFGNTRNGGNVALLYTIFSHTTASLVSTADQFPAGCAVSLTGVSVVVLVTAYLFWAGVGRIYMPPATLVTVTNSL